MAKGGGQPKGRPRKLDTLIGSQPESALPVEVAESSIVAEARKPIDSGGSLQLPTELEIENSMGGNDVDLTNRKVTEDTSKKIEEGEVQPLKKRGMSLGYVAPVLKNGIPTAKLCESEMEKETAKWKHAIILYIIGETPTISYLRIFLQKQCAIEGAMDIFIIMMGIS